MKNKFTSLLVSLFLVQGVFISCKSTKRNTTAAFYTYELQYIRTGMEGDEQVKVFAEGRNESECISQAKYEAVKTIVFKGIPGAPSPKPIVTELDAEEKYKKYFSEFFTPGGKYLNYVSLSKDGAIGVNDRFKVGNRLKIGVQVIVQKERLLLEFKRNGIVQ